MKFLFLILLCIIEFSIDEPANAWINHKDNSCNTAETVSRLASEIADKAVCEARINNCPCRCKMLPPTTCMAKQEFAQKSIEAAHMAQSNLASKLAFANELTEEKQTVKCILHELLQSKKQLEEAIKKEIEALDLCKTLNEIFDRTLRSASEVAAGTDILVDNLNNNIETIKKVMAFVRNHDRELYHKERKAKNDVEATRKAELKAVASAKEAKESVFRVKRRYIED